MRPLAKWTGYLLDSRHRLPTSQSDPSSETDMTRPQWLSPNLQDSKPRLDLGVLILRVNVLIECIHIRHKVLHAIHVHTLAIAQAAPADPWQRRQFPWLPGVGQSLYKLQSGPQYHEDHECRLDRCRRFPCAIKEPKSTIRRR